MVTSPWKHFLLFNIVSLISLPLLDHLFSFYSPWQESVLVETSDTGKIDLLLPLQRYFSLHLLLGSISANFLSFLTKCNFLFFSSQFASAFKAKGKS
jgi:hypothetical protein